MRGGKIRPFFFATKRKAGEDAVNPRVQLSQGRVANAEADAYVLGDQFDGGAIVHRISLRQVAHRFVLLRSGGCLLARYYGGRAFFLLPPIPPNS